MRTVMGSNPVCRVHRVLEKSLNLNVPYFAFLHIKILKKAFLYNLAFHHYLVIVHLFT